MIDLAVQQLTTPLKSLGFISLVAGIAKQQKVSVDGKIKTVPAYQDEEWPDSYNLLTPDESRSAISYFEVLSNRKQEDVAGGRAFLFSANVRLVVWLNTKRLSPRSAIPQAMAMCVSAVSGDHQGAGPIQSIRVSPLQEVPRSPEIFSKYTYDETETQYLMLPFDYFAFDFTVQFTISAQCPTVNIISTNPTC